MAKTPHPVDVRDEARIAEAVEFTATVRFDSQTYTVRAKTFDEIRLAARSIEATMKLKGGLYAQKRALVYAVTACGSAVMVPRARWA